jgi:cell division protein FtsB
LNLKERIPFWAVILVLFFTALFILYSDKGLFDLRLLETEKERLVRENQRLEHENLMLYREIDRVKNDLKYIENVARQELGMVGKDEVILRMEQPPEVPKEKPE